MSGYRNGYYNGFKDGNTNFDNKPMEQVLRERLEKERIKG